MFDLVQSGPTLTDFSGLEQRRRSSSRLVEPEQINSSETCQIQNIITPFLGDKLCPDSDSERTNVLFKELKRSLPVCESAPMCVHVWIFRLCNPWLSDVLLGVGSLCVPKIKRIQELCY